ncbi:MAG: hypothetical protein LQ343_001328 [Gyalolechia ehrenbergii]|nr:MAG: hypothetical protein LQ343_001328 [Gyalolechia ehrenbergii]
MAGEKHDLDDKDMGTQDVSPFMPMFEAFRDELDEHQDRRERIIKASRDITALSKKIVRQLQTSIPPSIAKEIQPRYDSIKELFTSVAPDLQGLNAWRYRGQISDGCQEYVEAISFQHYLETQRLITHQEAQNLIPEGLQLTANDYMLGLFDLTGELMRFGITSMATSGVMTRGMGKDGIESANILADLRLLRASFESLTISSSLMKKVEVMRESVDKVENVAYGMIIRGMERPKGWVPDLSEGRDRGREPVESY